MTSRSLWPPSLGPQGLAQSFAQDREQHASVEGPAGSRDAETGAPIHLLPPPRQPHPLCPESLGISKATRPRGHNTLEVRPWLRPWEPQGHRPSVRWSIYTALGWAVSPKGLPESERPGGKGWRRTSRDPAAPDADENGPRKAKSLGAGRPAGAGPLPLALLSAPSSGRLFSLVNLTSQPRADWLHSSSSKVLWPQARLP